MPSKTKDSTSNPRPGETFGHYQISRLIGSGATGLVFQAVDLTLRRDVALKFLYLPQRDEPPAAMRVLKDRFVREAKLMARLNHPSIVQIYEAELECDLPYLVMEYLSGPTLKERMAQRPCPTGDEICQLAEQIVQALRFAWDHHRIVHRDLKPANLIFANPQTLKVADLGIAKVIGDYGAGSLSSTTRLQIGTPLYRAPEQDAPSHEIDFRTDIYALGVILCELFTFRCPFRGRNPTEIYEAKLRGLDFPIERYAKGIPSELAALVAQMIEPDPARRVGSHEVICECLARARAEYARRGRAPAPAADVTKLKTEVLPVPRELQLPGPPPAPVPTPALAPTPAPSARPAPAPPTGEETVVMVRGDELSPGGRLGEFEIVRRLGRGPNGVVYAARHVATGQAVAIKCFSGQGTAVAGRWREAFGRWGPGIASLSERSIGTVHRFDSVGTVFYRVSDLYLGPDGGPLNLDGYRRQVGGTSGWFDQGVVRKFGMLLLGALEYAHGQGLAHGNLKPGNVLFHYLGEEGGCWRVHLILTDFALTAVLGAVPNPKANPWLSPEQREGRPADVASDVYAAGLFLLYCLTGHHRFPDSDRLGDLRPDLHDAWQPIIRKATRPEPERRFVSAEEMAQFVATVGAE